MKNAMIQYKVHVYSMSLASTKRLLASEDATTAWRQQRFAFIDIAMIAMQPLTAKNSSTYWQKTTCMPFGTHLHISQD